MPKVSDEYRATKREEITTAAMRAFRRRGFQATSMADIIAESGLSAGAIYGHFASKNEIVLSVATRVSGQRASEVDALARQDPMAPPAQLVRLLVEGMLQGLGSPSMLLQVWGESVTDASINELTSTVMNQLRGIYLGYLTLWHERQNGLTAEAAAALALEQVPLFIACAQGYVVQSTLTRDFDGEAYLASIETYLPR